LHLPLAEAGNFEPHLPILFSPRVLFSLSDRPTTIRARVPSSVLLVRVSSLCPTVRLRSEPECYRQSYQSVTRSYYQSLLVLVVFISLIRLCLHISVSLQDRSSPTHDHSHVVSPNPSPCVLGPGFSVRTADPAAHDRVRPSVVALSHSLLRPRFPFWDCDPPWTTQPELSIT
jgi:hypothetical protein